MTDLQNLNVLIVEDDADIGKLLQISLAGAGIDSVYAPNGQIALDYLETTQPDLILLDLNLPTINGWKVLEYAKSRYGKTFQVIVITANTDEVNRLVGKMQDVTSYIQKPFQTDEILTHIRQILELH